HRPGPGLALAAARRGRDRGRDGAVPRRPLGLVAAVPARAAARGALGRRTGQGAGADRRRRADRAAAQLRHLARAGPRAQQALDQCRPPGRRTPAPAAARGAAAGPGPGRGRGRARGPGTAAPPVRAAATPVRPVATARRAGPPGPRADPFAGNTDPRTGGRAPDPDPAPPGNPGQRLDCPNSTFFSSSLIGLPASGLTVFDSAYARCVAGRPAIAACQRRTAGNGGRSSGALS